MKKKIAPLVAHSYRNGKLDAETVERVADKMDRRTLKEYLHLLKQEEKKNQVVITSPTPMTEVDRTMLEKTFPNKQMIYLIDPEIISGIQVVNNDQEFEISLNQTFNDIIKYVSKND
jgi:F0F1-type ATP synthase delta subunit